MAPVPQPRLTTRYSPDHSTLRYEGVITTEGVLELCDEIELCLDYYGYRQLELQLDSPGGDGAALLHYIDRLRSWREEQGLIVGTTALTQASSAAAIILALGSPGHRRAYSSAQLVFHNARIQGRQEQVWTRHGLEEQRVRLAAVDERLIQEIVGHVRGALLLSSHSPQTIPSASDSNSCGSDSGDLEHLAQVYREVFAKECVLNPRQAQRLYLIDHVQGTP